MGCRTRGCTAIAESTVGCATSQAMPARPSVDGTTEHRDLLARVLGRVGCLTPVTGTETQLDNTSCTFESVTNDQVTVSAGTGL